MGLNNSRYMYRNINIDSLREQITICENKLHNNNSN